jgi:hypothetical protein
MLEHGYSILLPPNRPNLDTYLSQRIIFLATKAIVRHQTFNVNFVRKEEVSIWKFILKVFVCFELELRMAEQPRCINSLRF